MGVRISGHYLGGLGVACRHEPSGTELRTAAPVDNNGDGSSFSPTDLLATALATCMVTLIAIVAERDGLKLDGLGFHAEKIMESDPRRVGRVELVIEMPSGLDPSSRKKLERAALTCPVKRSLPEELLTPVEFRYPD